MGDIGPVRVRFDVLPEPDLAVTRDGTVTEVRPPAGAVEGPVEVPVEMSPQRIPGSVG